MRLIENLAQHQSVLCKYMEGMDLTPLLCSNAFAKKFTVTKTTDVQLHANTKKIHALLWNGLLYSLTMPWPNMTRHVFLACQTNAIGIMYWIPVPAYDPVKLTKLVRLSVKNDT